MLFVYSFRDNFILNNQLWGSSQKKLISLTRCYLAAVFFWGGEGESGHWNPSDFATSTLCLLIVSLCRFLLGGHFCNTVSQQTLWSSVPYSLSIPSSFTFLGCWWKSCVADVVIFNEFRTNILSLHCVQLSSFTGKSRPLMRTESYLICEYKEKLQNVVKIFFILVKRQKKVLF